MTTARGSLLISLLILIPLMASVPAYANDKPVEKQKTSKCSKNLKRIFAVSGLASIALLLPIYPSPDANNRSLFVHWFLLKPRDALMQEASNKEQIESLPVTSDPAEFESMVKTLNKEEESKK